MWELSLLWAGALWATWHHVSVLCSEQPPAAPGTAQTIQQDPSPPTPGKLLIHTHHPWSTTQALVEINRNVFLAPYMSSIQTIPTLQRFQGLGIPASSLHPSKFMRMLKMWMKAETHQPGRSINLNLHKPSGNKHLIIKTMALNQHKIWVAILCIYVCGDISTPPPQIILACDSDSRR